MNKLTLIWESPLGNFRVVQRSDTGYYYPQLLEDAIIQDAFPNNKAWHYLHTGDASKEDDRVSEPLINLAMRYEQCVNGTVHAYTEREWVEL
jgi:hypothetical protein